MCFIVSNNLIIGVLMVLSHFMPLEKFSMIIRTGDKCASREHSLRALQKYIILIPSD